MKAYVFYIFHDIFFSPTRWFTKTLHLLLVRPICEILELIVAHESKSVFDGGMNRDCSLSKQRISHCVVDTISHVHKASKHPVLSSIECQSTRSVSMLWAALEGVPLENICAAASLASPDTFLRLYSVDFATPRPLGVVFFKEVGRDFIAIRHSVL